MSPEAEFMAALDVMQRVLALHTAVTRSPRASAVGMPKIGCDEQQIRANARALGHEALGLLEASVDPNEFLGAVYVSAIVLDDIRQYLDAATAG